ncbi:hypothetical protein [Gulosibacter sediminis]|uniref:hypothetical protein n=1 Tax=Gulosibacter sediminis TaxID=1729695 RepID=UPI0024A84F7B|nr:hypothetical protein [Gulosibacter sediminis]
MAQKHRRHVVSYLDQRADKRTRRDHHRAVQQQLRLPSALPDTTPSLTTSNLPSAPRAHRDGPAVASPAAGGFRSITPIRQLAHRFSSVEAAGLYPYVTGARPIEPLGVPLGIDRETENLWCFDPWQWYERGLIPSTGMLIMGGYRQGKSFFLKRFVQNLVSVGYQAINTSDSKGEHKALAHALGGTVFEVGAPGSNLRINGLDAGTKPDSMPQDVWDINVNQRRSALLQQIVSILLGKSDELRASERSVIQWALDTADHETSGEPTIRWVYRLLGQIVTGERTPEELGDVRDEAKQLWHTLRRLVDGDLAGMFEDTSTATLDANSPYIVFDTYSMSLRGETALAITQAITQSWVQSILQDKESGRKWIVAREEGWRDMSSVAALESQRLQQKLAGEFGICQLLVVHEGGDFEAVGAEGSKERTLAEELAKGFAVKISFAQERGQLAASARAVGLTDSQAELIGTLAKGQCVVAIGERATLVDTMPISTPWEKRIFNTDQAMHTREQEEEIREAGEEVPSDFGVDLVAVDDPADEAQPSELPGVPEDTESEDESARPRKRRRPRMSRKQRITLLAGAAVVAVAGVAVFPISAAVSTANDDAVAAEFVSGLTSWASVWSPDRLTTANGFTDPADVLAQTGSFVALPSSTSQAFTAACDTVPASATAVAELEAAAAPDLRASTGQTSSAALQELVAQQDTFATLRADSSTVVQQLRQNVDQATALCERVPVFAQARETFVTDAATAMDAARVIPKGERVDTGEGVAFTCEDDAGCIDLFTPDHRARYATALEVYETYFTSLAAAYRDGCPASALEAVCATAATGYSEAAQAWADAVEHLRTTAPTVQPGSALYPDLAGLIETANTAMTSADEDVLAAWQEVDPEVTTFEDTGASLAALASAERGDDQQERVDDVVEMRCTITQEGC